MIVLPDEVRTILDDGVLCHLAAPSPVGPHVTPVVYVRDGDSLWGTTGRGTTKAARWRRDPSAGGLISVGDMAVTFRGRVTLHDALDPSTWWASVARAPQLARASARFTLKNRRFFAGYARDAAHVPLAWTPPARVVFSVDLQAAAVLDRGRVRERWGSWSRGISGVETFRRSTVRLRPLPDDVAELLGRNGWGTLGVDGRHGPVVVPCRWVRSGGTFHAVVSGATLALAGTTSGPNGSVVIDHASTWRAAKMKGVLLRGPATVFVPEEVRSGARALAEVIERAGAPPDDPAVVRIRSGTAVWWSGWSSGTVGPR
jgi:nitroimidazol reductase NimA-like FMN-containing flavoprotein (pyridoxamine 5'-phosphate oxidase superfamily)